MIPHLDQRFGLRTIVEPITEQISLDLARRHLRIDPYGSPPIHPDDLWLTTVGVPSARDWCERYLARSISRKTVELATNSFPGASQQPYWTGYHHWHERYPRAFVLPMGPVADIVSVSFTDGDGNPQTFDGFELDNYVDPALLNLAYGEKWPTARVSQNSVKVRYVVGYTSESDSPNDEPLPASIRAAMLLLLGHLYENRENTTIGRAANIQEIPLGVEALLTPYSLRNSFA